MTLTEPTPSSLRRVFTGPGGLRAGWRLAIYFALVLGLSAPLFWVLHRLLAGIDKIVVYMIGEVLAFAVMIGVSLLMARLERRTLAQYGLPWKRMFRARFWQGAALGFALIAATLLAMRAAGVFHFGKVSGSPGGIALYGAAYLAACIIIALKEEYYYRGYGLFTLTTGIGFWPAALAFSAFFGLNHYWFDHVSWLGTLNIGFGGLLFCLMLRRGGDLWLAIGCHTGLNWAEIFFFGVPDSGQSLPGSLLHPVFSGSAWLTGGATGPEGSLPFGLLLLLAWMLLPAWLWQVKYPAPAAGVSETASATAF